MKLAIISLEDEPEVREAVLRDLQVFTPTVRLEAAEDVDDALDVIREVDADGDLVALVLADHRLPGASGVDFLVSMNDNELVAGAGKVLLTGQADQSDTIRAINEAGLDHYLSKPWQAEQLQSVVRTMLTRFVLDMGLDPLQHLPALDASSVFEALGDRAD